jgi:hypothetical protein
VKVFSLQEVTITFQCIVDEMPMYFKMPSNYTISDAGAKSVTKASGNENM